uniref:Globin-1 n=1 Tax=Liolophura japonica TaxID=13599 RepID=GLB1_LIOJA|nr:RecName: Full=Globin-1; AltName: Full=Myoglobin I [Liolophura japonica]AAB25285.1 myoglobin I [Liolophura japonica, Peptide, 145 aa] [Liolophura japonica]
GISADQAKALKDDIAVVAQNPNGCGKALFIKMFEMNPGWVEKFPAWKGKSLDEIKASDKITNHGGKVINELANWINNINSASGILKSQGTAHKGRSIGIEYFENVLPVIDATFAQQMGGAYTAAMKDALKAAWTGVIVPGMKAGY